VLSDDQVLEVFRRLEAQGPLPAFRGAKITPDPFRAVVGCILSAQSPDARTEQAASALFAIARTPAAILALPDGVLEQKIRPAGLYNTKARNLRAMCKGLLERFDGQVPRTRTELMSLPGVGRKCADIVLRFTFGEPVVAVDTHVYRLVNRLGLARGRTEAATAAMLEPRVPERFRMDAHIRLIRHGKTVCTARRPRCEVCILAELCESGRSLRHSTATAGA
jgi:endonuclease III